MKLPYIPSLDGIRAVAVLLVFFSHTLLFIPGMLGVTIFFFLSGYLITTILRLEFAERQAVGFGRFYFKRCVRILPPFYLVLLISVCLQGAHLLGHFSIRAFLAQGLFFTNYWMIAAGDAPAPGLDVLWSLAVEEHFYLLFPLLYALLAPRYSPRKQAAILGSICGAVLAWRIVLHVLFDASVLRTRLGTDTRIDSILFGCILAIVANPVTGDELSVKLVRQLRWLLPVSVLELVFGALWHNYTFRETIHYSLDGLALFGCFTYAITATKSFAFRALNWGPALFLGRISYGFYLIHHVVIEFAAKYLSLPAAARIGFSLLLATVAATCTYYVVDRPMAKWRVRISARYDEKIEAEDNTPFETVSND